MVYNSNLARFTWIIYIEVATSYLIYYDNLLLLGWVIEMIGVLYIKTIFCYLFLELLYFNIDLLFF